MKEDYKMNDIGQDRRVYDKQYHRFQTVNPVI